MGVIESTSSSEIWKSLEKNIKENPSPLDLRILKEYYKIFKKNVNLSTNLTDKNTLSDDMQIIELESKISSLKKETRFKKWCKMSYLNHNIQIDSDDVEYQNPKEFVLSQKKVTSDFNAKMNEKNNYERQNNLRTKTISYNKRGESADIYFGNSNLRKSITSTTPKDEEKKRENNLTEKGLRRFFQTNKEKFLERISKGPPVSFRWISWIIASGIPENRSEESYKKSLTGNLNSQDDVQIQKDLKRTLSDIKNFGNESHLKLLYNVLKAFAINDKEVSYCQGMNFIAGYLLILSGFKEVESFYMLVALFSNTYGDNLGIRGFFINGFPLLRLYYFQFQYYFKEFLPDLNQLMETLDIPYEAWIGKWYQTLFTISLPLDLTVRVWDCIVSLGLDFLINFSISLLKVLEPQILKFSDTVDILDYFKRLSPFGNPDDKITLDYEDLILSAKKLNIKKFKLLSLKEEFEEQNGSMNQYKMNYNQLQDKTPKIISIVSGTNDNLTSPIKSTTNAHSTSTTKLQFGEEKVIASGVNEASHMKSMKKNEDSDLEDFKTENIVNPVKNLIIDLESLTSIKSKTQTVKQSQISPNKTGSQQFPPKPSTNKEKKVFLEKSKENLPEKPKDKEIDKSKNNLNEKLKDKDFEKSKEYLFEKSKDKSFEKSKVNFYEMKKDNKSNELSNDNFNNENQKVKEKEMYNEKPKEKEKSINISVFLQNNKSKATLLPKKSTNNSNSKLKVVNYQKATVCNNSRAITSPSSSKPIYKQSPVNTVKISKLNNFKLNSGSNKMNLENEAKKNKVTDNYKSTLFQESKINEDKDTNLFKHLISTKTTNPLTSTKTITTNFTMSSNNSRPTTNNLLDIKLGRPNPTQLKRKSIDTAIQDSFEIEENNANEVTSIENKLNTYNFNFNNKNGYSKYNKDNIQSSTFNKTVDNLGVKLNSSRNFFANTSLGLAQNLKSRKKDSLQDHHFPSNSNNEKLLLSDSTNKASSGSKIEYTNFNQTTPKKV